MAKMNLVKLIEGGIRTFDEKAFYRATGGVRHFLLEINDELCEAFYLGEVSSGGMHVSYASRVKCGDVSDVLASDVVLYYDGIYHNKENIKLYQGDSNVTLAEIKMDDIFINVGNKLEWNKNVNKLKVGKAYRIKYRGYFDGIFMKIEHYNPDNQSLRFVLVNENDDDDEVEVDWYEITQKQLYDGTYEIYELSALI